MNDKLSQMIDELVAQKTFGLDGLEAIKALKTRAEKQEAELTVLAQREMEARGKIHDLQGQIDVLKVRENLLKSREDVLAKREVDMTKLECQVEMQKALAAQGKEFVGMIFRNQVIMTSKLENVALPGVPSTNGGYPTPSFVATNQPASETKTTA